MTRNKGLIIAAAGARPRPESYGVSAYRTQVAAISSVVAMPWGSGSGTTVPDLTGRGNNGAYHGPVTSWTLPNGVDKGMVYNGSSFLEIPAGADLSPATTGAWTLEMFAKWASLDWVSGGESDAQYRHYYGKGQNSGVGGDHEFVGRRYPTNEGGSDAGRTFADGVTTNTSKTLTSATAAFVAADDSREVIGAGIGDGNYIDVVVSATEVTLKKAATATASGVSIELGSLRRERTSGYCFNATGGLGAGSYAQYPHQLWNRIDVNDVYYVAHVINKTNAGGSYPHGYVRLYVGTKHRFDTTDADDLFFSGQEIIPTAGPAPARFGTRDLTSFMPAGSGIACPTFYNSELDARSLLNNCRACLPREQGTARLVNTVDTQVASGTGTTMTLTVPAGGVAAGHVVMVATQQAWTSGAPTITDTRGNTYTRSRSAAGPSNGQRISAFIGVIGTELQAGDSITIAFPSAADRMAIAKEFSGTQFTASLGTTGQNAATGTSTTPTTGAGVTTTNADQLVMGVLGIQGPSTDGFTEDWVNEFEGNTRVGDTHLSLVMAHKSVNFLNTYVHEPSLGTSRAWANFVLSYQGG